MKFIFLHLVIVFFFHSYIQSHHLYELCMNKCLVMMMFGKLIHAANVMNFSSVFIFDWHTHTPTRLAMKFFFRLENHHECVCLLILLLCEKKNIFNTHTQERILGIEILFFSRFYSSLFIFIFFHHYYYYYQYFFFLLQ